MKLYIISLSVSAYTLTGLMIPLNFINTEQTFQNHPNTHAQSRHIAVSSICFQTRKRLVHSELKHDKNKYSRKIIEG
jgi:hypothetical protein